LLSLAAIIVVGFVLGMRHALDPDHVIAVTTIVSRQRSTAKAGLIGVMWGVGHTLTIFLVGAAIILFNVVIPPRLGLTMELAVGGMLILLGILNLTGGLRWLHERFTGAAGTTAAIPAQADMASDTLNRKDAKLPSRVWRVCASMGFYNLVRPLVVGLVHGLAGSAAVALLVITTIRQPWWAIAYLLLFGVGTIAGMMAITLLISGPFVFTARRFSGWNQKLTMASGLLSLGFGLFISYQIGFVDGLFTNHPQWTPR